MDVGKEEMNEKKWRIMAKRDKKLEEEEEGEEAGGKAILGERNGSMVVGDGLLN